MTDVCVGCNQPAGQHNCYKDADGGYSLVRYEKFAVCDSCIPWDEPLANEMEPEEAALRCWFDGLKNRCIPFDELAESLMGWTERHAVNSQVGAP